MSTTPPHVDHDVPHHASPPAPGHPAEMQALHQRREMALPEGSPGLARVGLALSGGGVRSATFGLGLLRGLAQQAAEATPDAPAPMARIDYLSTVSGGGYIGAMWTRLVSLHGLAAAQAELARSDSPLLHWLRRNGRYLTPAGSRDIGTAAVTYLRAWLAIHTEFMFACFFLGLIVLAPHLVQHSTGVLDAASWSPWVTPWWLAAVALWVACAPGLIAAYWAAREPSTATPGLRGRDLLFLVLLAIASWGVLRHGLAGGTASAAGSHGRPGLDASSLGALALSSVLLGTGACHLVLLVRRAKADLAYAQLRHTLTTWLRGTSTVALGLAALGALDALSWWLLHEFQSGNRWLWGGVGLGGTALVVLRSLAQPLQRLASDGSAHARTWLPRLLNLAGLLGVLILVSAWLVFLQWWVFAPQTLPALEGMPALLRALLVGGAWALWVLLTSCNNQMANNSSLHGFYRARITRAYLAVGNPSRQLDAHDQRANVTCVTEGDDVALTAHRPHERGGPLHLITTCLNQTRDDRSGLYNADRKGLAVTASAFGLELGPDTCIAAQPKHDLGSLGRWIAVSGAAASPGAGAYTSRGLALLIYLLGIRLGHWMRAPQTAAPAGWLIRCAWSCLPKPLMLASEASATFYGPRRPWWYLSDGGHFENTGVYPLLKRELDFIILSDAGCDAQYEFGDIENLVRKARIDFGAEIDFYTRDEAARLFAPGSGDGALSVLSPEDMGNEHSRRGVLLARIRYRERQVLGADGHSRPHRPEGTLLVVKPNLHNALDVDVLAYAREHSSFPHESTGDQSFDEAQWESYHRLGEDFGRALREPWLAQLPGWRGPAQHPQDIAGRLQLAPSANPPAVGEPLWRRSARAAALGTSVGLGASGTLLLALWQAQEQVQHNRADQQSQARQLVDDVSKGLQGLDLSCPQVSDTLVTQTAVLMDLRASPALRALERTGIDRLAGRLAAQCNSPAAAAAICLESHQRMHNDLCALVLRPTPTDTAFNYWHPSTASWAEQREAARALWARLMSAPSASNPAQPPPAVRPPSEATLDEAPAALREACQREKGFNRIYIQIYDEESRPAAVDLSQRLKNSVGAWVQVAPIENVSRSAELRQERAPVPWPRATWIVHDSSARRCALALQAQRPDLLHQPQQPAAPGLEPWVRDLAAGLSPQDGVMELWLPPRSSVSGARP